VSSVAALCGLAGALPATAGQLSLDPDVVANRSWAQGATAYRQQLLEAVQDCDLPDARQTADMYARYALCNLLATAGSIDLAKDDQGRDLATWLLGNPTLAGTLALALRPEDSPAGVLTVLRTLMLATDRRRVYAPDLFTAFAVTWDNRVLQGGGRRPQDPMPDVVLQLRFEYFFRNAGRMSADLLELPWQLAAFLVDCDLPESECNWALVRYAQRSTYKGLYSSIPLDPDRRKWRPGAEHNLENIRRWGGTAADRAFFAANVAKACGRPAAVVTGPTRVGGRTVWVMLLTGDGTDRFGWTIDGWSPKEPGDFEDPQTGRVREIHEAFLLARALRADPGARIASDAYYHVAALFKTELPAPRILDLLEQATRKNPCDTRPWVMLADMMGEKQVSADRASALYSYLLKTCSQYPEFTRDILHALLQLIPQDQPDRLCRVYEATFSVYQDSPSVVAGLMDELADTLRARGQNRAALTTYRSVVRRYRSQAQLIESALSSAESLYREQKSLPAVVDMYEEVFRAYRPKRDEAVQTGPTSYYYRLVVKLAGLYREARNPEKADEYDRLAARFMQAVQERAQRTTKRK